jgi:hypothetical protein
MWRGKYSVIKSDDLQSLGKTDGWIGQNLASIPLLRAALIYMESLPLLAAEEGHAKGQMDYEPEISTVLKVYCESAVWLCSKSPQAPHVVNWIVDNI